MASDPSQISTARVRSALTAFGCEAARRIARLHGGAGASRKFVVDLGEGSALGVRRALLRCTPRDAGSLDRLMTRHAVMRRLHQAGVPVVMPLENRDGGTMLANSAWVFELIPFVDGDRWVGGERRSRGAGRLLARLHDASVGIGADLLGALPPPRGLLSGTLGPTASDGFGDIGRVADDGTEHGFLSGTALECGQRAAEAGLVGREACLVHGDFHPGNMRWRGDAVVGLFDFDACRRGDGIEEAALASVHFSIDRGSKAMDARAPWPDPALLESFWIGYSAGRPLSEAEARTAPWIAAGAFAMEALGGIRGGSFGEETISFATGVAAWLVEHADGIGEVIAEAQRTQHGSHDAG